MYAEKRKYNALILHTDGSVLEAYWHVLDHVKHLRIEVGTDDLHEVSEALFSYSIDIVFIGGFDHALRIIEDLRTRLLLKRPRTKMVLLGVEWLDGADKCINWPIRGIIDMHNQSPKELRHVLKCIMEKGWNFDLLLEQNPELAATVKKYAENIPEMDGTFWKLLPMLTTNFPLDDVADYMNCSLSTLKRMLKTYCSELGATSRYDLLVIATENRWIDRRTAHAAYDQMLEFKFNNGTLLKD